RLEPAMNDVYFRPMLMLHQTVKLAPAVGADSHDKSAALDLFWQTNEPHIIVFLRPMDGEAPWWPAQRMYKHRDLGRVSAEMRVQMLDTCCSQPGFDLTGLGQVSEVHGQRTITAIAHAQCQGQCL